MTGNFVWSMANGSLNVTLASTPTKPFWVWMYAPGGCGVTVAGGVTPAFPLLHAAATAMATQKKSGRARFIACIVPRPRKPAPATAGANGLFSPSESLGAAPLTGGQIRVEDVEVDLPGAVGRFLPHGDILPAVDDRLAFGTAERHAIGSARVAEFTRARDGRAVRHPAHPQFGQREESRE